MLDDRKKDESMDAKPEASYSETENKLFLAKRALGSSNAHLPSPIDPDYVPIRHTGAGGDLSVSRLIGEVGPGRDKFGGRAR